jgi:hypothetical protein
MTSAHDGSSDQRRSRRVAAVLPIRWIRDTGVVKSASADVSENGLFFRSTEPVTIGELLQFECEMPDGLMRLLVTVRHISNEPGKEGFGVSLYAEGTSSARRWERFCADLMSRADK